ncbi:prepilin peptidase [Candidatus Woesebacteria bacterium]|nr:prepilin peptidase [Candidatus Woesebacteria bacterium]
MGLALGSFLGALTYRLARKESFVKGRSGCPRCGANIKWYDNVPVLSFLLLGGRCRSCHKKISLRDPLIEIVTALGVLGIYLSNLEFPLFLIFILLATISIFVIDLENEIIPDELIFLGLGVTTMALLLGWNGSFYLHFLGGFSSSLFLLLINLITKSKGMGLGDVKYALFAGTFLGFPKSVSWLFLSFLTGASLGVILILLGRARLGKHIPFGPFLAASFLVTAIFGENLVKWLIG